MPVEADAVHPGVPFLEESRWGWFEELKARGHYPGERRIHRNRVF